jgi:DNA processing protein
MTLTSDTLTPDLAARIALSLEVEPGNADIGEDVLRCGAEQVASNRGLRLFDGVVEDQLARATRCGAVAIWPGHPEWPTQLDDLGSAAPLLLWIRGRPLRAMALRSVAIVGSRACSRYGQQQAETLASDLALRGWTIVSGGAFGIDAAAHAGALAVGGTTVLVTAAGVDQCYPRAHHNLYNKVVDHGAVISEFPLGSKPHKGRFLARNRVIAALSRGTVIVEAASRSGARATANVASDLNRHVMAVPGPITSDLSVGCHDLIRERAAVLIRHVGDCLEQVTPLADMEPPSSAMLVFRHLAVNAPSATADIGDAVGLPLAELQALLVTLEGAGLLVRRPHGWSVTDQVLSRIAMLNV